MNESLMVRRTVAQHGPHPVDVHVGGRVRLRRTFLGMSQTDLGKSLGVTFQQVQKNESGFNRIGASRLHQLSLIFDVPVTDFFERDSKVRKALHAMAKATVKDVGSR